MDTTLCQVPKGKESARPPLQPPQRNDEIGRFGPAGKFRILKELPHSPSAVVFRAELDGAAVALKVLRPHYASNAQMVKRFERGARLQNEVAGSQVPRVLDSGTADGLPYVAMPFLDGETLAERCARQRPGWAEGLRIAERLATAVRSLHERGVVHRDLKPKNVILVGASALPVLIDFGLAKSAGGEALARAGVGAVPATDDNTIHEVQGTPAYMSPEQLHNQPLDHRADLFSLGVVLFELFLGELPFGHLESAQLYTARLAGAEPRWSRLDGLRPELARLIGQLLHPYPEARPSAAQVEERLAALAVADGAASPGGEPMTADESRALVRELIALETQYAPPDRADQAADARWFDAHWGTPELTRFHGQYVAVYNGAVVAHGPHPLRVKRHAVEVCRVHPQRPLIEFVTDPNL